MNSIPGFRVLIVDDSAVQRTLFERRFGELSADVKSVEDGETAIREVEHAAKQGNPFKLVVLDIYMPGMRGTNAAKRLREVGYTGLLAACTASSSAEGRRQSQEAGIDVYFDKMVVNAKLCAALLDQAASFISAHR